MEVDTFLYQIGQILRLGCPGIQTEGPATQLARWEYCSLEDNMKVSYYAVPWQRLCQLKDK